MASEDSLVWIVSGLPRSGTSMVMQMLGAAGLPLLTDGERAADADNRRGYFELEAVKALPRDARFLSQAVGRGIKVVAPLLQFLPPDFGYAVILIERAMPAVLASQRTMMARSEAAQEGGVASLSAGEERALAKAFERSLDKAKERMAESATTRRLILRHEEVLTSPEAAAQLILDFLERHGAKLGEGVGPGATPSERERVLERMASVVDPELCRHSPDDSVPGR